MRFLWVLIKNHRILALHKRLARFMNASKKKRCQSEDSIPTLRSIGNWNLARLNNSTKATISGRASMWKQFLLLPIQGFFFWLYLSRNKRRIFFLNLSLLRERKREWTEEGAVGENLSCRLPANWGDWHRAESYNPWVQDLSQNQELYV